MKVAITRYGRSIPDPDSLVKMRKSAFLRADHRLLLRLIETYDERVGTKSRFACFSATRRK